MKFKIDERGRLYGFECEDDEKHVVIPDGVTTICSDVFRGDGIESVIIPDSVTSIESCAFCECINLTEIKFSANLIDVSGTAFHNTKWLDNQKGFVVINEKILCRYRGNEKNVVIPENIQYISDNAFSENPYIESVVMSDNITKVDFSAFSYCKNLKSIRFSKNLKRINYGMFEECKSLTEINIPENIKMIGRHAFANCYYLEKIKFPEKIIVSSESLEDTKWFRDCKSDFVTVNDMLYKYKGKQTEVVIPENIRIICNEAFAENQYIEKVVMPDSVTHIGYGHKIDILNSAFENCVNLKEVIFSEKLLYIGSGSFSKCTSLESISIPESVEIIDKWAFDGCEALRNIKIHGNPVIMKDAFNNTGLEFDWVIQPEFEEFNLSYDEEKYEYTFSLISENKTETRKFNAIMPRRDEGITIFRDITTGKYGVKNKIGDVIVKPEYSMIFPFSDGYAVVLKDCGIRSCGVIDITGNVLLPFEYGFIRPDFPEGKAAVRRGWKWGFINVIGKCKDYEYLVSPQFEEVSDYIQGHAAVKKDGKWGLIRVNLGKRY